VSPVWISAESGPREADSQLYRPLQPVVGHSASIETLLRETGTTCRLGFSPLPALTTLDCRAAPLGTVQAARARTQPKSRITRNFSSKTSSLDLKCQYRSLPGYYPV
jgi:hypothetical protein